jgi:hypothetical protein
MSDFDSRNGNIVIGVMLVAIGMWVALARSGALPFDGQVTLWPLILCGIGLARFLQTPPGASRQGLLFLAAGGWLLAGQARWFSLGETWPLLVIAFGLIIAFNSGRRPREAAAEAVADAANATANAAASLDPWSRHGRRRHRRHGMMSPLAVIGIWVAIMVGAQVSGVGFMRSSDQTDSSDRARMFSVMGRSEYTSRAPRFRAAEVTNVMGRSELDLRDAKIPPGGEATVQVFSAMGEVVVRVPPNWTVDTRAMPAMGAVRDQRFPAPESGTDAGTEPAPRLVLRGLVLMGRLTIRS